MKLQAIIAEQNHTLTIVRRAGRIVATVDERSYDLEVREIGPGAYLLLHETEVYNCQVAAASERPQAFEVHLGGKTLAVTVVDPKRLRSGHATGRSDHGVARILAPMPGKVVRVLVELGTEVEAGAGIVVVEAMKMQNEMKAPKAGTVVTLNARDGATVNTGEVLAVIE